MLRLVAPALLAATVGLLLSSTSAESQRRSQWQQESWSPFGGFWDDDTPRRRRPQAETRTYGRQYGNSGLTVRSAPKARVVSRPSDDDDEEDDDDESPQRYKPTGPKLLDGGPRPDISPMSPMSVAVATGQPAGTIVIDTKGRQLFYVTGANSALRYPISVGRDGFTWTGTEKISRVADWPDWHPPAEMRERDPRLPEKMTGGLRNPLGAKSLYLGNSLYRIHGTNDAKSIGYAASSGCFRMMNGHVVDLARRVGVGTKVVVLSRLGAKPVASSAPVSTSGSRPQSMASR